MNMELWEKEVIFSMQFPKEKADQPDEADEEVLKILENDPETKRRSSFTLQEFLEDYDRNHVYLPRFGAGRRSKKMIAYAVEVCEQYKIDTRISKGKYSVDISMNIGYGFFEGDFKRALEKLIALSDDISFFSHKDDAEALILAMSYYTHDRRRRTREQV